MKPTFKQQQLGVAIGSHFRRRLGPGTTGFHFMGHNFVPSLDIVLAHSGRHRFHTSDQKSDFVILALSSRLQVDTLMSSYSESTQSMGNRAF